MRPRGYDDCSLAVAIAAAKFGNGLEGRSTTELDDYADLAHAPGAFVEGNPTAEELFDVGGGRDD